MEQLTRYVDVIRQKKLDNAYSPEASEGHGLEEGLRIMFTLAGLKGRAQKLYGTLLISCSH